MPQNIQTGYNPTLITYSPSAAEKSIFAMAGLRKWLEFDQAAAPLPGLLSADKLKVYDRRDAYAHVVNGVVGTATLDGHPAVTLSGTQSIDILDSSAGLGKTTFVAGSGGTNGVFALPIPAPADGGIQATGTFTVSGGSITAVDVPLAGSRYPAAGVTINNAALAALSAGLTGASVTITQGGDFPVNADYSIAVRVKPANFAGAAGGIIAGKNPKYHSFHFSNTTGRLNVSHGGASIYAGSVDNTAGVTLSLLLGWSHATGRLTVRKNGAKEFQGSGLTPNTDNTCVFGDILALAGDRKLRGDSSRVLIFGRDLTQAVNAADLATVESYLSS